MFTMAMPGSNYGLVECGELKNAVCCTRFPNYACSSNIQCYICGKPCCMPAGSTGGNVSVQCLPTFNTDVWVNFNSYYSVCLVCSCQTLLNASCAAASFLGANGNIGNLTFYQHRTEMSITGSTFAYITSNTIVSTKSCMISNICHSCDPSGRPIAVYYQLTLISNFSGPVKKGTIYSTPSFSSNNCVANNCCCSSYSMTVFPLEPSCVPYS